MVDAYRDAAAKAGRKPYVVLLRDGWLASSMAEAERVGSRRQQLGSGQRGDKIRTYRERDDLVIDHRAGTKTRLGRFLAVEIMPC